MIIELEKPLILPLSVDAIQINPTNVFIQDGTAYFNITFDIISRKRKPIDQETLEIQEGEIALSSPYFLENPTSVSYVPKGLIDGLVFASLQNEETKQQVLQQINQQIEQLGYNEMFTGSLEGLKIEIKDVII